MIIHTLSIVTKTTTKTTQASWPVCIPYISKTLTVGFLMSERDSASRKRERQLRSWLRHERMTVRMELAAALHHSAFKSAGPRRTTLYEARRRSTPRRMRCSSSCTTRTPQGGGLPAWQSRRGHRNGFHSAPWSPCSRRSCPSRLSMFLCRRWLTSRWISSSSSTSVPEQVIDVPKISLYSAPQRTMLPEPQLAEQLVEVPLSVPSFDNWGFDWCQIPWRGDRQPRAVYKCWARTSSTPLVSRSLCSSSSTEWWRSVVAAVTTVTHSANCAVLGSAG